MSCLYDSWVEHGLHFEPLDTKIHGCADSHDESQTPEYLGQAALDTLVNGRPIGSSIDSKQPQSGSFRLGNSETCLTSVWMRPATETSQSKNTTPTAETGSLFTMSGLWKVLAVCVLVASMHGCAAEMAAADDSSSRCVRPHTSYAACTLRCTFCCKVVLQLLTSNCSCMQSQDRCRALENSKRLYTFERHARGV